MSLGTLPGSVSSTSTLLSLGQFEKHLLCFDLVCLSFDVRTVHLPLNKVEDARAGAKPPERGREVLGAVPIGADEQWDGVGAGLGPCASGHPCGRLSWVCLCSQGLHFS